MQTISHSLLFGKIQTNTGAEPNILERERERKRERGIVFFIFRKKDRKRERE